MDQTTTPKTKSKYSTAFPFDLVCVFWEDAHSTASWKDTDELELEECICTTVGFLYKQSPERIMVVDSLIMNTKTGGLDFVSGTTTIPSGMVREVKVIKKGKGGN